MKMTLWNTEDCNRLLSALMSADSVLLFTHVSPDGDTLGSALALKHRLIRLGKKAEVLVNPPYPSSLRILPGIDDVVIPEQVIPQANLCIAIDVASRQRIGNDFLTVWDAQKDTWAIDHHAGHDDYKGNLLLDASAPATGILIYRLFQMMKLPISREEALCLYTAVSTDTGNFIYDSTTAECFAMMNALNQIEGFAMTEQARILHREKEPAFLRLLAKTLPTMRMLENDRIAGLTVTRETMANCGASQADCDGLIDYAIDTRGVDIAYSLRETEDGAYKCSLRSKAPYCVNEIAGAFGGGGHKRAAGCTFHTSLDEAKSAIENALTKEIHESVQL